VRTTLSEMSEQPQT